MVSLGLGKQGGQGPGQAVESAQRPKLPKVGAVDPLLIRAQAVSSGRKVLPSLSVLNKPDVFTQPLPGGWRGGGLFRILTKLL